MEIRNIGFTIYKKGKMSSMHNKEWKKRRPECMSVESVIEHNTGIPIESFLNPSPDVHIVGLKPLADCIRQAIDYKRVITIYGDYDADGITSSAILYTLLKALGHERIEVILPRRFTEGYGLSMKGVDRISEGLVITVDNGIAAVDQVAAAKAKGLDVVVLDHHLVRDDGKIPAADVVCDPNAIPGSDFSGYCGAGLAYKLACLMVADEELLDRLSCFAAIGTVADVMPLVNDNRNIVIRGLKAMNACLSGAPGNMCPYGLKALLHKLELSVVTEGDIGFKIGPVLNAAGRMHDDGAAMAFQLLTDTTGHAYRRAEEMIKINERRKAVVADGYRHCEKIISDNAMENDEVLLLYTTADDPDAFWEGVCGILAARLTEVYKRPAIVMTETHDGTKLKGSGRTYGNVHLKKLLDTASSLMMGYGGHAGAAGLSCALDMVGELHDTLCENLRSMGVVNDEDPNAEYFDIEVNAHQLPAVVEKLRRFAPWGTGNPAIVFKVNNISLVPRAGKFYRVMGNAGQHIKLFGQNYDVVGFDLTNDYHDAGEPMRLDALGIVSENVFNGTATPQIEMICFRERAASKAQSPLAQMLAERMKSKGFTT